MRRDLFTCLTGAVLALMGAVPAAAGITVYEEGDKKLEIGGRVQIQYLNFETDGDPAGDEEFDEIFFRRLRLYIAGTVTRDWYAKIQFDFGKAEDANEVAIKDAYIQYLGLARHKITIGNAKTPFSREFLTSSKRQQLIERSFAGEHNFGSPDRNMGVRLEGQQFDKKLGYMVSAGAEDHDPAVNRMDFDSPANRQSDWNQGWLAAARVDWHPLGYVALDQGDFHSDSWRFNVSLAAYTWMNDDDNNIYTNANGVGTNPDTDIFISIAEGIGRRWETQPLPLGLETTIGRAVAGMPNEGFYSAANALSCPQVSCSRTLPASVKESPMNSTSAPSRSREFRKPSESVSKAMVRA